MPKITAEFFIDIGSHSEGPHLEYFGIAKGQRMGLDVIDEGPDKILGSATARTNENPVPPPNLSKYFFLRRKLIRISPFDRIYIYFDMHLFLIHASCSFG
jgi:hypothetical protein